MLVDPVGQERTTDEYRALLAHTGFRLDRTIPARHRRVRSRSHTELTDDQDARDARQGHQTVYSRRADPRQVEMDY